MASCLQSASATPVEASEEDYTLGGFSVNVSAVFQEATLNAITLLVGVFPEVVLNKAMPSILESLDNAVVKNVTLVDIAVWKGEEGVAVCDSQGKLKVAAVVEEDDERPKTAEEKWERELKKELQAKKGASATSAAKAPAKAAGKPVSAKAAAAAKAEKGAEKLQLEKERANRERVEAIRLRVLGTLQVLESILNGVVVSLDEDAREAFEMWMSRSIEADESCRKRECRCETWKERQEGTLPTDFESNWRSYLEGYGNGLGCCHIAFDGRRDFSSRDFRGSLQKRPFSCFDEAADGRQGRLRCIESLVTRSLRVHLPTDLLSAIAYWTHSKHQRKNPDGAHHFRV
ncbi:hypothetical protein BJ741DRAFT_120307 [Chytriomyces cf. hyalinus JEL632]|nr:hypothetical protein BJ741DRAFT_120307 [Chytriomyces cf. hyalinus JEL632]